jgi:TPR repeat protein
MFAVVFALALAVFAPVTPQSIIVDPSAPPPVETPERAKMHRIMREQFTAECHKGHQAYCYELGRLMQRGLGGPADADAARRLFERACRGHVTDACIQLDPHLIDADLRKTMELGCKDGNQGFCVRLASMLKLGIGGRADPVRAENLLDAACRKGYAKACAGAER